MAKRKRAREPDFIDFGGENGVILRDSNKRCIYAISDAALAQFEVTATAEQAQIDRIFNSSNDKWDAVHLTLVYRADSS